MELWYYIYISIMLSKLLSLLMKSSGDKHCKFSHFYKLDYSTYIFKSDILSDR